MILFLFDFRFTFRGNAFAGIATGAKDELKKTFTDNEVQTAFHLRETLTHCEPWSQHLTNEGIKKMNKFLKHNDANKVKEVINKSITESSAPWCIDTLKTAVTLVCTKCPTFLKEALPISYY